MTAPPQRVDILDQSWIPGEDKTMQFSVNKEDGTDQDINTGGTWQLRFRIFRFPTSTAALITKTNGAGITIPSGTTGAYNVAIPDTDTDGLAGGDYWYDSWRTDEGSEADIQYGYIRIGALTTAGVPFPGTFTYDPVAAGTRDQLRLLLSDTNPNTAIFSNEELDVFIAMQGSARAAAILAVGSLATRFSMIADKQVGNLKISYTNRAESMRALMSSLSSQSGLSNPMPFAGGISRADKAARAGDPDRVAPAFSKGMDDFPGNGDNDPVDDRVLP